jgi:outer membrane immunogenic protein
MHRLIAFVTVAGLSVGLTSAVFAADLPRPGPAPVYTKAPSAVPFSWSGFYVGADVGGAWSRQSVTAAARPTIPGFFIDQADAAGELSGSSVIGGFYAGYNWAVQSGWVLGVEGDFNWTHLNDTATAENLTAAGVPVGSGGFTWSRDLKWLASARGRVGYAVAPTALAYVTGGAAWGGTDYRATDAFFGGCSNCIVASPFSATRTGYAVGGGLEWAWDRNWVLRGEYLYYRLQGETTNAAPNVTSVNFNWGDLSVHTARVGLAYKFGP